MIELIDVHKSFGKHRVLTGLNLSIEDGKTTVIIGRSGGGKSERCDGEKRECDETELFHCASRPFCFFRRRFFRRLRVGAQSIYASPGRTPVLFSTPGRADATPSRRRL